MKRTLSVLSLATMTLWACAADPIPPSHSPSDPANPNAPEAPMESTPILAGEAKPSSTAAEPTPEPAMQHQHPIHGAAQHTPIDGGASDAEKGAP